MSLRLSRPAGNWLLDALPEEDYGRLLDDLQPVSFPLGEVIYEPGGQMDHAYFTTTFHASLLYTMINGATAEMGLVGNEGVLGVALFMGGDTTPNRAVVQGAGQALKLPGNGHHFPFVISHFSCGHFSDLISWCFVLLRGSLVWLRDERTIHEITRRDTNKTAMANEK